LISAAALFSAIIATPLSLMLRQLLIDYILRDFMMLPPPPGYFRYAKSSPAMPLR